MALEQKRGLLVYRDVAYYSARAWRPLSRFAITLKLLHALLMLSRVRGSSTLQAAYSHSFERDSCANVEFNQSASLNRQRRMHNGLPILAQGFHERTFASKIAALHTWSSDSLLRRRLISHRSSAERQTRRCTSLVCYSSVLRKYNEAFVRSVKKNPYGLSVLGKAAVYIYRTFIYNILFM